MLRARLMEAGTAMFPIGPRHVLALGQRGGFVPLPDDLVHTINRMEILAADSWVAYHPSAGLRDFINETASARPHPGRVGTSSTRTVV